MYWCYSFVVDISVNETSAHATNESATMLIEPLFKLFNKIEVMKVKASWEAPKRADAIPDSAL